MLETSPAIAEHLFQLKAVSRMPIEPSSLASNCRTGSPWASEKNPRCAERERNRRAGLPEHRMTGQKRRWAEGAVDLDNQECLLLRRAQRFRRHYVRRLRLSGRFPTCRLRGES